MKIKFSRIIQHLPDLIAPNSSFEDISSFAIPTLDKYIKRVSNDGKISIDLEEIKYTKIQKS